MTAATAAVGSATGFRISRSTPESTAGLIGSAGLLVVLAAMPWLDSGGGIQSELVVILYYLALAQMWNLLAGFAGLISVGQQMFVGIGIYTQWTVNYALAVSFATLGHALGSKGLLDAGVFIQEPWPSFVFGTVVLISVVLVQLAGMRFLRRFLNAFFVMVAMIMRMPRRTAVVVVVGFNGRHILFVRHFRHGHGR